MKLTHRSLFSLFFSILFTAAVNGHVDVTNAIHGKWQHALKPAELFIDLTSGVATVYSHKLSPESVGLTVIKNIVIHDKKASALMFNGELRDYESVVLMLNNKHTLIVKNQDNEEILRLIRPQ